MDEFRFQQEREIAAEIREYLDTKPELHDWIQRVIKGINETGEIEDGVYDKIDDYLLNNNVPLRQKFRAVNYYDEGSLQLMFLIFDPVNSYEEDYDEEEEIDIDFEIGVKGSDMPPVIDYSYLLKQQKQDMSFIMKGLNISEDTAYFLLRETKFDKNAALLKYTKDRDDFLSTYNIKPEQVSEDLGLRLIGKGDCEVCAEENVDLYGLQCGHGFCDSCWRNMIAEEVQSGNSLLKCMQTDCNACLLQRDIHNHADPEVAKTYDKCLASVFVSTNPDLRNCPNEKCNKIMTISAIRQGLVAECTCGARICWLCKEAAHDPCSCENKAKWEEADINKVSDGVVNVVAKHCPKCNTIIQKDKGCNHITCGRCRHQFCWMCLADWKTHGGDNFFCPNFKPEENKDADKQIQNDPDRHAFFFEGYNKHNRLIQAEAESRKQNLNHLIDVLTNNFDDPLSEDAAADYADELLKIIDRSRHILLWSYPHAFYLELGSSNLRIFYGLVKSAEENLNNLLTLIQRDFCYSIKDIEKESVKLQASIQTILNNASRAIPESKDDQQDSDDSDYYY